VSQSQMSQQWEYCVLVHVIDEPPSSLCYYGLSGAILHEPVDWDDAVARLGAAAWELVGIAADRSTTLYFKRPLQPGRAIDDAL
jgi:hypothetical protein